MFKFLIGTVICNGCENINRIRSGLATEWSFKLEFFKVLCKGFWGYNEIFWGYVRNF